MPPSVRPIPAGYHALTPLLTMKDVGKAIGFYQRAFGAEERTRFLGPDEKSIMHGEVKIGDSIMMLGEEHSEMGCQGPQSLGGTSVNPYLYVDDADQAFPRALSAGAKADKSMADMFRGDRCGKLTDPFGHRWSWRRAWRTSRRKKSGNVRRSSFPKWRRRPDSAGIQART